MVASKESESSASASHLTGTGEEQALRRFTRPNALKCFSCGEPGHRKTACPNQNKRGLLLDEPIGEQNPVYDLYSKEEHTEEDVVKLTSGDIGHFLVIR